VFCIQIELVVADADAEEGFDFTTRHVHPADALAGQELTGAQEVLAMRVARAEAEALLAAGVGHDELGLDVEHPDPPGLEQLAA